MECSNCGHDLQPDGLSCPDCGTEQPTVPVEPDYAAAGEQLCPSCGEANPIDNHFCEQCGKPLKAVQSVTIPGEAAAQPEAEQAQVGFTGLPDVTSESTAVQPAPEPELSRAAAMTCPQCGTLNRPEARFCQGCGQLWPVLLPEPVGEQLIAKPEPPIKPQAISAPEVESVTKTKEEHEPPADAPSSAEAEATLATEPPLPPTTVCLQCGSDNRATARFCIRCGRPLASVPADQPQPESAAHVDAEPLPAKKESDSGVAGGSAELAPAGLPSEQMAEPANPKQRVTGAGKVAGCGKNEAEGQAPQVQAGIPLPPAPPPLEVGSQIAARYRVLEVLPSPGEGVNLYAVVDLTRCWSCDWPVQDSAQPFCSECGAEIGSPPLDRRLQLREVSVEAGGTIIDGERAYDPVLPVPAPAARAFPNGIRLAVGQASNTGMVRSLDEDSVLVITFTSLHEGCARPTVGLFVVADGIGGYEGGEWASRLAVQTIAEQLLSNLMTRVAAGEDKLPLLEDAVYDHLRQAIALANERILSVRTARQSEMGTTLTLALLLDNQAYVANVGDSRTYVWGQDGLQQVTTDHSLIASLIASGAAEPDEIYTHPQRSAIYRSLGDKPQVTADLFRRELAPGNLLLLCCDGLWEMARNEGIEDVLLQGLPPQEACDELVRRANRAGGEDNISVVIVQVQA